MYVQIAHTKFLLLIRLDDYNYAALEFIYNDRVLENTIQ